MVDFIKYKGQEFPMVFDFYVQSRIRLVVDEAAANGKKLHGIELLEYMVFYCIESGCDALDKSFTIKKTIDGREIVREITMKDVAFMISETGPEVVADKINKFKVDSGGGQDGSKKKNK